MATRKKKRTESEVNALRGAILAIVKATPGLRLGEIAKTLGVPAYGPVAPTLGEVLQAMKRDDLVQTKGLKWYAAGRTPCKHCGGKGYVVSKRGLGEKRRDHERQGRV